MRQDLPVDRCLIDTHIFLWWLMDSERLGEKERMLISSPEAEIYLSAASIWEIELKRNAGKLSFTGDPISVAEAEGFLMLDINAYHCQLAAGLPEHHKDPFDRLLIAQAKLESLVLLSSDRQFSKYDVHLFTD